MDAIKTVNYTTDGTNTSIQYDKNSEMVSIVSIFDGEAPMIITTTFNELMYALSFFQAEKKADRKRANQRAHIA